MSADCAHHFRWSTRTCVECGIALDAFEGVHVWFSKDDHPTPDEWMRYAGVSWDWRSRIVHVEDPADVPTIGRDEVTGPAIYVRDLTPLDGVRAFLPELDDDGNLLVATIGATEVGPVSTPREITSIGELDAAMSKYGFTDAVRAEREIRGRSYAFTLDGLSIALEEVIEENRAAGLSMETVKREVAKHWLRRPKGVLARLGWAWKLLFGS